MDLQYLSVHVVTHEDEDGELLDVTYYCSDWCARQDPDYQGWWGCEELEHDYFEHGPWTCPGCGKMKEYNTIFGDK